MDFLQLYLSKINPPFGTEADSPFLAKQSAGRWKNTVGQKFQIRILQSLNWILAMNAWWSRQDFLNWCLRQTCVFASHATKTQICLQCCLVLRFFCDKVCETRDIEFAISIFTPARFVLSKLVNHCCCWSSQAKPSQAKTIQIMSSQVGSSHQTTQSRTQPHICWNYKVYSSKLSSFGQQLWVFFQFLQANQAIEHIHSFSNVFILFSLGSHKAVS